MGNDQQARCMRLLWKDVEMGCGERPAGKADADCCAKTWRWDVGNDQQAKRMQTVVQRRGDGMWGTTSRQSGCRLLCKDVEMGCGERPVGKVDADCCAKTWSWDVGNDQQAKRMQTVVERRGDGMWGTTSRQGGCRDLLVVEDQTKTRDLIMHRISLQDLIMHTELIPDRLGLHCRADSRLSHTIRHHQTEDDTPSDTIRQRMTHHQTPSDRG